MTSLTSALSKSKTNWLPILILILLAGVVLTVLACGSILAFTFIATSSVEPVQAGETGSLPRLSPANRP
jgi:hypothetical protein